ncbi:MAG: RNA polymerase sigma-70 factor [Williamsia sp.]|nr:RNA polymerase sigma-70 factor [Williamsia sp.]
MGPTPSYDEAALLQQIAAGDEQAFTVLFNRYWKQLYNYLIQLTKSHEITEEIVADVFLKLWTGRELIVNIRNIDGFLFKVAYNKTMDFFKLTARDQRLQRVLAHTIEATGERADQKLLDAETQKILHEAIAQLSPQRKLVYHLHRIEGLSHEQIAERLNLSRQTVKNTMTGAIRSLLHFLEQRNVQAMMLLWWGMGY